jgi:hypothetical protein
MYLPANQHDLANKLATNNAGGGVTPYANASKSIGRSLLTTAEKQGGGNFLKTETFYCTFCERN